MGRIELSRKHIDIFELAEYDLLYKSYLGGKRK